MRVWIRKLPDNHPSGINLATASFGFRMLGAETVFYQDIQEILGNIARNDIIMDGVRELNQFFESKGILTNVMDYPDVLLPFTHRKIWTDTLGHLRRNLSAPLFIKPTVEKLFPGTVIRSVQDWAPLVSVNLQQEVYCSQLIDIRNEYRVFIRYDHVLDVRPYLGDYHFQFDPEELDKMVRAFTSWKQRPNSCAIDIAVTADRKTVFLEMNDGYAVGAYGLATIDYARFIATRWAQLMDFPDSYENVP